jgi:hypothetical protein
MSGLFVAGQFSATFPKLAEVNSLGMPYADGAPSPFDSAVQGAVTAVSAETGYARRHVLTPSPDLRDRCPDRLAHRAVEG